MFGDEGDANVHVANGVCRVEGAVDEIDAAVLDDDVVDREQKRLFFFLLRLFLHQREQIGEVVCLVLVPDKMSIGFADDEFLDDGRPPVYGSDIQIDYTFVERYKGFLALRFLDLEPAQGERERVGVQADIGEAHLAVEGLRQGLEQVGLQDRRNDKEADDREENEKDSSAKYPLLESAHGALRWRQYADVV